VNCAFTVQAFEGIVPEYVDPLGVPPHDGELVHATNVDPPVGVSVQV
jgi:hypothetical protein